MHVPEVKVMPLLRGIYFDADVSRFDLLHFFNTISFSRTPWITTFETILPDYFYATRWGVRAGVRRLANASCKRLIAFSDSTRRIQEQFLDRDFRQYRDDIIQKTVVMHPIQETAISDYSDKPLPTNRLHFTIVGDDCFRKGGREIVKVF
jgi:hypothetical protein